MTPAWRTSAPACSRPPATNSAIHGPDSRVSAPSKTFGLGPRNVRSRPSASPKAYTVARSSASPPATPRIPSVPNSSLPTHSPRYFFFTVTVTVTRGTATNRTCESSRYAFTWYSNLPARAGISMASASAALTFATRLAGPAISTVSGDTATCATSYPLFSSFVKRGFIRTVRVWLRSNRNRTAGGIAPTSRTPRGSFTLPSPISKVRSPGSTPDISRTTSGRVPPSPSPRSAPEGPCNSNRSELTRSELISSLSSRFLYSTLTTANVESSGSLATSAHSTTAIPSDNSFHPRFRVSNPPSHFSSLMAGSPYPARSPRPRPPTECPPGSHRSATAPSAPPQNAVRCAPAIPRVAAPAPVRRTPPGKFDRSLRKPQSTGSRSPP